jgi:Predicted divalent heavy-metal cations transporter
MIYVSMIELFAESKKTLIAELGDSQGYFWTVMAFFLGILITLIIDKLIPEKNNPHEFSSHSKVENNKIKTNAKNKVNKKISYIELDYSQHLP